jgi:hypothetical protein
LRLILFRHGTKSPRWGRPEPRNAHRGALPTAGACADVAAQRRVFHCIARVVRLPMIVAARVHGYSNCDPTGRWQMRSQGPDQDQELGSSQ